MGFVKTWDILFTPKYRFFQHQWWWKQYTDTQLFTCPALWARYSSLTFITISMKAKNHFLGQWFAPSSHFLTHKHTHALSVTYWTYFSTFCTAPRSCPLFISRRRLSWRSDVSCLRVVAVGRLAAWTDPSGGRYCTAAKVLPFASI